MKPLRFQGKYKGQGTSVCIMETGGKDACDPCAKTVKNKVLQFVYHRLETGSKCAKQGAKVSKEQDISVWKVETGDRDVCGPCAKHGANVSK